MKFSVIHIKSRRPIYELAPFEWEDGDRPRHGLAIALLIVMVIAQAGVG